MGMGSQCTKEDELGLSVLVGVPPLVKNRRRRAGVGPGRRVVRRPVGPGPVLVQTVDQPGWPLSCIAAGVACGIE